MHIPLIGGRENIALCCQDGILDAQMEKHVHQLTEESKAGDCERDSFGHWRGMRGKGLYTQSNQGGVQSRALPLYGFNRRGRGLLRAYFRGERVRGGRISRRMAGDMAAGLSGVSRRSRMVVPSPPSGRVITSFARWV